MAKLIVEGNVNIMESFQQLANMPSSVLVDMAKAAGEKAADAQRKTAGSMLVGKYYKGGVASGVNVCTPVVTSGGVSVLINFKGNQHGNRIGEIAFINEYGKKSQPARTFIETANKTCREEVVSAAEAVLDRYLASKGF